MIQSYNLPLPLGYVYSMFSDVLYVSIVYRDNTVWDSCHSNITLPKNIEAQIKDA